MSFKNDFKDSHHADKDMRSLYPTIAPVDFGPPGTSLTQNVRKIAAEYIQGKDICANSTDPEPKTKIHKHPFSFNQSLNVQKVGQLNRTSYYEKTHYVSNSGTSELSSPYLVNVVHPVPPVGKEKNLAERKIYPRTYPAQNVPSERGLVGWLAFILDRRPFLGLDIAAETLSFSLVRRPRKINSNKPEPKRETFERPAPDTYPQFAKDTDGPYEPCYPVDVINPKDDLEFLLRQEKLFKSMKEDLLKQYEGYFVLFCDGKVMEKDKDQDRLLSRVYRKYGVQPYYIDFVGVDSSEEELTIYTPFE